MNAPQTFILRATNKFGGEFKVLKLKRRKLFKADAEAS